MKTIKTIVSVMIIATSAVAMASQEIVIRPAEKKDFEAITDLLTCVYNGERFKAALEESCASSLQSDENIDDVIEEKVIDEMVTNYQLEERKRNGANNVGLFVAYAKKSDTPEKLVGYCRFKEMMNCKQKVFMRMFIDESVKKQEVGKMLAKSALQTFKNVTQCEFRVPTYDQDINDLCERYCTTKEVTLDAMSIPAIYYVHTIKQTDK